MVGRFSIAESLHCPKSPSDNFVMINKLSCFPDKETDPRVCEIMEASNLNLSLCYLKTQSYVKAIEHCDKILDATGEVNESKKEKALFRKGECHLLLHEYEKARMIFADVMEKYPNNSAAKRRHYECDRMEKDELKLEKERYQKMFKNFST